MTSLFKKMYYGLTNQTLISAIKINDGGKNYEKIIYMIDNNYDPSITDKDGNTAFLVACRNGNYTYCTIMLEKYGEKCLPAHINRFGESALWFICGDYFGNYDNLALEVLKYDKRVDYIGDTAYGKHTMLMSACKNKMNKTALEIVNYDCCPYVVNNHGCTALIYACRNKMWAVAWRLLKLDCKPNQKDEFNNTAFDYVYDNTTLTNIAPQQLYLQYELLKVSVHIPTDIIPIVNDYMAEETYVVRHLIEGAEDRIFRRQLKNTEPKEETLLRRIKTHVSKFL